MDTNYLAQTKLNVNMFTADLAVLIGLVSATLYPTAMFTYVARIDPLLALAETLRSATSG